MGRLASRGRRLETVVALLDEVVIAGAATGIVGVVLNRAGLLSGAQVVGLTAAVTGAAALLAVVIYRAHSRAPSVGPEALVGLAGVAVDDIEPGGEGMVMVEGELWRARSLSGYKIGRGERVVVRGVDGLTLLVEAAASPSHTPSR